jgi:glycosyltransferase involved in cell wall biosynthesis
LGQEIDTDFFDPEGNRPVDADPPIDGPFILSAGLERRDYATLLDALDMCSAGLVIAAGSPWSKDAFSVDRELPAGSVVDTFDSLAMRELYRRATVVVLSVHPTERACGMNVVGEAWAMGRPVVASATDGLIDFITSGVNGLLVPPGDADALRRAIDLVLGDPVLADRLGRAGQEYVREHLSLARFRDVVGRSIAGGDGAGARS